MHEFNVQIKNSSFLPEMGGDVLELALMIPTIEALVGGGLFQGAEVLDEGAHLDIVEVMLHDARGHTDASAVPSDLQRGVFLMNVLCQQVDAPRVCIAPHEGDAGNLGAVFCDEGINSVII